MKFCKTCNLETERGRDGKCKSCLRRRSAAWAKANPIKVKAARDRWTENNPEKAIACKQAWKDLNSNYFRTYYEQNRESIIQNVRAYSAANKAKVAAGNRAYRIANKDKIDARVYVWKRLNPEKLRVYSQNRRALQLKAGGSLSLNIEEKLLGLQKGRCACCKGILDGDYHLDHIMPLKLGGDHNDSNMQLLHSRCNLRKNALHPVDFMQRQGFLL